MTGRSDVNRLLAQAAETGNLFSIKDGGYTLRPAVINSMKLRMETVCDRVRKMSCSAVQAPSAKKRATSPGH